MSVLSEVNQKQVEEQLVELGYLKPEELELAKAEAKKLNQPILVYLISTEKISQEDLTKTTARALKIPYVNLIDAKIKPEILSLLPKDTATRFMAVPLGDVQNRLVIAMLDADNVQAVDYLSSKIGRPLKVYMASEEGIQRVIRQYGVQMDKDVTKGLEDTKHGEGLEQDILGELEDSEKNGKNIVTVSQDSPISRALSSILEYAARNDASDVHMEPTEHQLKVRIRVDGVLREIMKLPKSTEPAMVSRIKILSNLKIDEHRIPQDGQFTIQVDEKEIDLRVAIAPVVWGEQVVIRLLNKSSTIIELQQMGFTGRALRMIKRSLVKSNGMILTSGPTGSGKSTSMYAMIQEIKNDKINIVTLEDPVEYKIEGVNQIQINTDVGLTFASGLRSVLRQDPNVVMVGEIRDGETANLAVQAALTGHLVFSTLHTNSAAGILPRLLDMKIEPYLIASTVNTVIGQRLVRRIGAKNEPYQSSAIETAAIHQTLGRLLPKTKEEMPKVAKDLGYESLPLAGQSAYTLLKGKDNSDQPGGYKGRLGLFEVFEINEGIEELILSHATSSAIQKKAMENGMVSMREDGYLKALAGLTTLDEVNRVAAIENA